MNQRIKELAKQAGWDGFEALDERNQKFAELIIEELLDIIRVNARHFRACDSKTDLVVVEEYNKTYKYIKQHFGVEEPQGWVCPKCGVDRTRNACPQGHTAALTGDCPMYGVAQ